MSISILVFICQYPDVGYSKSSHKNETLELLNLFESLKSADINQISKLIKSGADINAKNSDGQTLLISSIIQEENEITKLLILNKADVNIARRSKNGYINSPLSIVAYMGEDSLLKILLEAGANPNPENGALPLWMASKNGCLGCVKLLLESGAHVDDQCPFEGGTALFMASQNGFLSIVDVLIESGADVNTIHSKNKSSPLFIAAQEGYLEIVQLLIKSGSTIDSKVIKTGTTPLLIATSSQHKEIVKILVDEGANINEDDYSGQTALFKSAGIGNEEIVKFLIEKGADVNKGNPATPLYIACQDGYTKIVKLLLENGAEINLSSANYNSSPPLKNISPLWWAARWGQYETVKLLLDSGADTTIAVNVNGKDFSPLYVAKDLNYQDIVDILIQHGAKQ
jgi:ankyrin repeat protein